MIEDNRLRCFNAIFIMYLFSFTCLYNEIIFISCKST